MTLLDKEGFYRKELRAAFTKAQLKELRGIRGNLNATLDDEVAARANEQEAREASGERRWRSCQRVSLRRTCECGRRAARGP